MGRILVIAGHGLKPNGTNDPGASGNGVTEAGFLRDTFIPAMKKYAPSNVDFHTKDNFYAFKHALNLTGYDDVIELHLDAASPSAEDGHVVIHKDFNPDAMDLRIRDVINKHVGVRYNEGFSYRDNLYNLSVFRNRGISYRLVELAFITHKGEMDYLKAKYDAYARDLVSAIINKPIEGDENEVSKEVLDKLQKQVDALEKQNSQLKKQLDSKVDKPSNPDIPSNWAKDVWKKQVMQGYFDGSNPKMPLTREQAAEVLDRFAAKIREYEVDPLKKRVEELEKQVAELSK